MQYEGLQPNEWTYNATVKVHSSVGDFAAALDTVQQMHDDGFSPSQSTWDVILSMAHSMERNDIVQQVQDHMKTTKQSLPRIIVLSNA